MSVSTTANLLTSFKAFPNLPPEVQCSIWAQVCRLPRIIVVASGRWIEPTSLVPPAVLHTSHQARQVALKACNYTNLGPAGSVFLNLSVDIIYLRSVCHSRTCAISDLRKLGVPIRSIATDFRAYLLAYGRFKADEFKEDVCKSFPSLEQVFMIVNTSTQDSYQNVFTKLLEVSDMNLCYRDDIGKLQMDRLISQMRLEENDPSDDEDTANSKSSQGTPSQMPVISFKQLRRDRDWTARNKQVQSLTERRLLEKSQPYRRMRLWV